ncbi:aminotransferase class I/II-fold pyridoxal phosphate-dependent enzyme [Streptomyces sp. NPDC048361]|uniref:aminotransferase class I/II-fold pyridoxal phosphate-dependent enzyme n=1 Tax=Streptomyces sp. NPDC048361 TaxID=3154720 RepID=UPI0034463110
MSGPAASLDLRGAPGPWPEALARRFTTCLAEAAADGSPARGAPHSGNVALREWLADREQAPVDKLVITTGVRSAVRGLVAPHCCTVLETPTFSGVPISLRQLGLTYRCETWDALPQAVHDGCAVWVTSPFRSPLGDSLTDTQLRRLAEAAPGVTVVQNLSYAWMAPPAAPPAAKLDGVAYVSGLHKIGGPGARLGWAVADDAYARLAPELRGASPAALWQDTWLRFLRGGGFDELVDWRRAMVQRNRLAFVEALGDCAKYAVEGEGPNLSIVHPALGETGMRYVTEELAGRAVQVSPGGDFALSCGIRVNVDNLPTETCVRAAEEIESAVVRAEGRFL